MNPMESNVNNLLPMGYGSLLMQGIETAALLPMYSTGISESLPPAMKTEGVVTNLMSRKRSRDQCPPIGIFPYTTVAQRDYGSCSPSFSFLGEDISLQINQQDLDINRLIAQHVNKTLRSLISNSLIRFFSIFSSDDYSEFVQMEKVRFEIEVKRRNQVRRILEVIEERLVKRLRTKEEEVDKMLKMNFAMEEQIKSLCVENQIWRDLAQSNEAAANAMRMNLQQVLSHVGEDPVANFDNNAVRVAENPLAADAQSSCDSNGGGDRTEVIVQEARDGRLCRECGKGHARVLVLPCRHLCLCTVCVKSVHTCPICKSTKTASVHVNVY